MRRNGGGGEGGMRGEAGRTGKKGRNCCEKRGPEGGRSSVSSPALCFLPRQPAVSSRDARARSYVYRVDELARIIIFPRNVQLQACIAAPSPFCAPHMGKLGERREIRTIFLNDGEIRNGRIVRLDFGSVVICKISRRAAFPVLRKALSADTYSSDLLRLLWERSTLSSS